MTLSFEKSFASHSKAKYWSECNTIKPENVALCSGKKYWFDCELCGHTFDSNPDSIVRRNTWCRYCYNSICDDENCLFCYNKSFASHEKSKYWSNKNKFKPRDVTLCSNKKSIFECDICNHEFEARITNIVNNKWCPYCCNHSKTICINVDCKFCHDRSFASHPKSKYWSNKNVISPRSIMLNHSNKCVFNCNICNNEFEATPCHIISGTWCPICVNKTERKLYNWLLVRYPNIIRQKMYEWCTNDSNKKLRFDFEVNEKLVIEVDGPQHFRQVSNWESPEIVKKRDEYKIKCALENNKHIIHISQVDIHDDKNNWEQQLDDVINELLKVDVPQLRLIGIDVNHFISYS